MAAQADLRRVFRQQFAMFRGVRIVTAGTVPFGQGRVDIFFLHGFLKPFMTFQAEFSPGAFGQIEGVGRENRTRQQSGRIRVRHNSNNC